MMCKFHSDLLIVCNHNIIPLGCGNFIVPVVMDDVGGSLAVAVEVMPLVMGVVDVHLYAYSIS